MKDNIISFESAIQRISEEKNKLNNLLNSREAILNKLEDEKMSTKEWAALIVQSQDLEKEIRELLGKDYDEDEDFEIEFDCGLKARNEALESLEHLRQNGYNISE